MGTEVIEAWAHERMQHGMFDEANADAGDIYFAHISNAWRIDSPRTLLSTLTYPWGRVRGNPRLRKTSYVNAGPEALVHGGRVFIVYSGSGCGTDDFDLEVVQAQVT